MVGSCAGRSESVTALVPVEVKMAGRGTQAFYDPRVPFAAGTVTPITGENLEAADGSKPWNRPIRHAFLGHADLVIVSPTLTQTWTRAGRVSAICVQSVDIHISCSSHYISELAPFFIDPRAK